MFLRSRYELDHYSLFKLKRDVRRFTRYHLETLLRFFKKPKKDIDVDPLKVDETIKKGVEWLIGIQRNDGSIGSREYEIWDTANAVLALTTCKPYDDLVVKKGINFIRKGRLKNGGFYHMYFPPEKKRFEEIQTYCTETTAVAILALSNYYGGINKEIIDLIDFVERKQQLNGGWILPHIGTEPEKFNPNSNYFPSATGYALQAITTSNEKSREVVNNAIKFLESTQNRNGSWGRSRAYFNTESYAIKNIIKPLSTLRNKKEIESLDELIESAINYVSSKQNADGSFSTSGPSSKDIATVLYLQSLIYANDRKFESLGVEWLIKNQKDDGSWDGGSLREVNCDVFATSEVLITLSMFKEKQ
jgi:squalene cyclase